MRVSALTFLPLLQGALALPFGDFQIPSLHATEGYGGVPGYSLNSTTIAFTFKDTNTNSSSECYVTFPSGDHDNAAFPSQKYRSCGGNDPNFGFKFSNYDSIECFQLDLLRRYSDPSVGDPPMDIVTLFASVNVTRGADYSCKSIRRSGMSCHNDKPMIIPITAATAK
ncbi:MAG: hypothetical protein M1816_002878 [Peltula sp. TS41687]|nr:MAG: hypothetical protein M1816_002878 [Peltula sp. TS41687]